MTVKELKEKLHEYPEDTEVCIAGDQYKSGYFVLEEVYFDEDVNAIILDT